MKKLFLALVAVCLFSGTYAASDDKSITQDQLPEAAQSFIKKHFADQKAVSVTVDNEMLSKDYKVIFENGSKVEFDGKGVWTEVDCKQNAVPEGVAANEIQQYVATNYAGQTIVKIDKEDRGGCEVKLSNGVSLKFDSSNAFVRIDD